MEANLKNLPPELVEGIVEWLELDDIAALRLSSRTIKSRVSRQFNTFFQRKTVELSTETLQKFVQATTQGDRLGRFLRDCTITGIILCDDASQVDEAREPDGTVLAGLLAEAFRNVKRHGPDGYLSSLSLRVTVYREDSGGRFVPAREFLSWEQVWRAAVRTFQTTVDALQASQLAVRGRLDVFGGLRGCSLSSSAFLSGLLWPANKDMFRSVRHLSLSLSIPHTNTGEPPLDWDGSDDQFQERYTNSRLPAILQALTHMPQLTSLDLHWYHLHWLDGAGLTLSVEPLPWDTYGDGDANMKPPQLTECSLRGVWVTEMVLLRFLLAVRPQKVTLTDIQLFEGTYDQIFQYLTNPESGITSYHLDDLCEDEQLVFFNVPGSSKFPYSRGNPGPSTLTRAGDQVVEPISYRYRRGIPLPTEERSRWWISKSEEFGANRGTGRYDFVALNSPKDGAGADEFV